MLSEGLSLIGEVMHFIEVLKMMHRVIQIRSRGCSESQLRRVRFMDTEISSFYCNLIVTVLNSHT